MENRGIFLVVAISAALGSLVGFLNPDGAGWPVRTRPFRTKEQSVRFTAWTMLVIAVIAFAVWLLTG